MLLGRDAERKAIDALLAAAREGISGALVLSGEPGVGKTALLDYATAGASDLRILRTAGIESETELPFASLHALLRPVLDRLEVLPPQRRALSVAFGLADDGGDRFMVGAGVLSLLSEIADDGPVLCLVDDVRWLDRGSIKDLAFAARRLHREGVVVLFAVRDREYRAVRDREYRAVRDEAHEPPRDYAATLTAAGIPELKLTGLDPASAAALLDERGVELSTTARSQLVAETRGNPLALRELAPLVAAEGLDWRPVPLTERLRDAFGHHIRSLPATARTLLLLAAGDDTGDVGLVLSAASSLGTGISDVAAIEEAGLISVSGGSLTFRHPLVRAAVYHGASLEQRVATHTALAAAYGEAGDSDRRAWHRALATVGADKTTARDVEQVGDRAAARNDHAAASAVYHRAAQLSPGGDEASRRVALACEAGIRGGQPDWVRPWAERALPKADRPDIRSRLTESLASCEFARGELRRAHQLFCAAAR